MSTIADVTASGDPIAKRCIEAATNEAPGSKRRKAGCVPIIDVAPFFAELPDSNKQAAVVEAVAKACEEVGFFIITGHGIEIGVLRECAAAARHFFSLSEDAKSAFAANGRAYGFFPMSSEALGYDADIDKRPDVREAFSMGPNALLPPPGSPGAPKPSPVVDFCYQETPWPSDGCLRKALEAYYEKAVKLADGMLRIFAAALMVDADFFLSKTSHHASSLRVIHYPKLETEPLPGQLRCGAHSDICTMTILWQDVHGGLQVLPRGESEWMNVNCPEEGLVINLGDLFMRWTNDRWLSTPHRVICPRLEDESQNVSRISMPFFQILNSDAEVKCFSSCLRDDERPKYAPTTQGEDLLGHFKRWGKTE